MLTNENLPMGDLSIHSSGVRCHWRWNVGAGRGLEVKRRKAYSLMSDQEVSDELKRLKAKEDRQGYLKRADQTYVIGLIRESNRRTFGVEG